MRITYTDELITPSVTWPETTNIAKPELNITVSSIPTSKRGRKLLIGDLDKEVMNFIYNLREVGGVVNGKIAVAAAKGIINSKNKEF